MFARNSVDSPIARQAVHVRGSGHYSAKEYRSGFMEVSTEYLKSLNYFMFAILSLGIILSIWLEITNYPGNQQVWARRYIECHLRTGAAVALTG